MKKLVIVGFLIWLGATVALRFAGQYIFRGTSNTAALILLAVSFPLMVMVAWGVLHDVEQRALGAIALVAPGMLLDAVSTIWFPQVFPNIRPDAAPLFGGWILFCNVVVLIAAAMLPSDSPARRQRA